MSARWFAVLALVAAESASADDDHAGRAHSHWWLERGLEPSWYAGAAVGHSTFNALGDDGSIASPDDDDNDINLRLFAGIGLGRHVAFEFGYVDFGEASFSGQSDGSGPFLAPGPAREDVAVDGFDLAVVGKLPLTEAWALFGRAGMLKWDSTYEFSATFDCCGPGGAKESADGSDWTYGAGVQYDGFLPLRITVEYGVATFAMPGFPARDRDRDITSIGASFACVF